jgi:hypothetical protein
MKDSSHLPPASMVQKKGEQQHLGGGEALAAHVKIDLVLGLGNAAPSSL